MYIRRLGKVLCGVCILPGGLVGWGGGGGGAVLGGVNKQNSTKLPRKQTTDSYLKTPHMVLTENSYICISDSRLTRRESIYQPLGQRQTGQDRTGQGKQGQVPCQSGTCRGGTSGRRV